MGDQQRERLGRIITCAKGIHTHLEDLALTRKGTVHFRPTDSGVTLVGLHPDRPQRGHPGYRAEDLSQHLDTEFQKYCDPDSIGQGRETPEKKLQSFLISNAYQHNRRMSALALDNDPTTNLLFVADELALFTDEGRVVCDVLAFQPKQNAPSSGAPVLIELKSQRLLTRLVEQLDQYARVMERYIDQFEQLYSTLLGQSVHFSEPVQKWLIWPGVNSSIDPREQQLVERRVRVVQYSDKNGTFEFTIGRKFVEG